MFTSSGFQLFDGILTNPLVYFVNRDIIRPKRKGALPGERVLFKISVTFMIATGGFPFPRDSHTR